MKSLNESNHSLMLIIWPPCSNHYKPRDHHSINKYTTITSASSCQTWGERGAGDGIAGRKGEVIHRLSGKKSSFHFFCAFSSIPRVTWWNEMKWNEVKWKRNLFLINYGARSGPGVFHVTRRLNRSAWSRVGRERSGSSRWNPGRAMKQTASLHSAPSRCFCFLSVMA